MTAALRPTTLVTGASGGIGADLARVFAKNGHDVALLARSRDKLDALADEIAASGRPRPIVLARDLTEPGACAAALDDLAAAGGRLDILVNNAGYGLMGPMAGADVSAQLGIIRLNVDALTELALRALPTLIATRGKILNVASVAGFFPGPNMAIYYASKAYILSFSAALAEEVAAQGVTVTALCPGVTATGFQARAGFQGSMLATMPAMSAMAVAEAGYRGLTAGRRRVTPGLGNKFSVALAPFVPHAIVLPLLHRMQKRRTIAGR